MPDQQAQTIAQLFVDHIVCRHGVPEELLSDRGANFLSELVQGVCDVLGVRKVNTSGYHPQTDGLVEKFNSTLIAMISKCCDTAEHDWDDHLQPLLFAYRSSVQDSTKESPFFLLYGRDPRLPTETALSETVSPYMVDLEDYRTELVRRLSNAWALAKEKIGGAQHRQKAQYDKHAKESQVKVGDRVMVYMPGDRQGKDHKLARPFHGPYRVLTATPTNVEVALVDRPADPSIFVALDRIRLCYPEQTDQTWTGARRRRRRRKQGKKAQAPASQSSPRTGPITRSQTRGHQDM